MAEIDPSNTQDGHSTRVEVRTTQMNNADLEPEQFEWMAFFDPQSLSQKQKSAVTVPAKQTADSEW